MQMPDNIGTVHILGIGGIGMSAIAEILTAMGYTVQGSDQKDSPNVRRLREKGIRVFIGHDPINLVGARQIVISTAVKSGNVELEAARAKGLPIIRRAEMLAELMRFKTSVSVTGTHGKTTTTSLLAHILVKAGLDPTVITGGIISEWGSNARLGEGRWMVVEADESDGTFVKIPSQIGVVTNIDPEHLDYFGSVEEMHRAYEAFYNGIPFYGLAVTCIDHPVVREMIERLELRKNGRPLLTYGLAEDADVRLKNQRSDGPRTIFDVALGDRVKGGGRILKDVTLPLPGEHNASNAIAAIAVAIEAEVPDETILASVASFCGVQRRFTLAGTWNGVAIFDDYAHHPVEIAAVLKAARLATKGRVIAAVQPHRYSRVQELFDDFSSCFGDADMVLVTPIYTAGEAPIDGVTHTALADGIAKSGHRNVVAVDHEHDLADEIRRVARSGDYVLVMGAGTNSEWAYALPEWLAGEPLRAGGAL